MIRQPNSTELRDWSIDLMVAAPIIAFPFARTHTAFFIIIFVAACIHWHNLIPNQSQKPLLLGIAAIAGPIFITGLALPLLGISWPSLLFKKLSTLFLGGIFGLATMSLIKQYPGSVRITKSAISATVLFWIFDGIIQMVFGQDLFGVPLNNGRVGIFASNPLDFAYYFPLFAVFPIIHLYGGVPGKKWLDLPGKSSSFLLLVFSIIITFSGGCRNSMLLICIVSIAWASMFANEISFHYRRLLIPFFSGALITITIVFYRLNDVFQQRADQTMKILISPSY